MKYIGYILGGLLSLFILIGVVAVAFLTTLDPNAYKEDIRKIVEAQTGRSLSIDGPISLSYYPVLGFSVSQASLGNPDGFEKKNLASIDKLQAGVEVLPLLGGAVRINSLRFERPAIQIIQKADGTNNLGFGTTGSAPAAGTGVLDLKITKTEVIDGRIEYQNMANGQNLTLSDVNFALHSFAFNEVFNADFSADINASTPDLSAIVKSRATMNVPDDLSKVDISSLDFGLDITPPGYQKTFNITGSGAVIISLDKQTLQLKGIQASWDETVLSVDGQVRFSPLLSSSTEFEMTSGTLHLDELIPASGQTQTSPAPSLMDMEFPADLIASHDTKGRIKAQRITYSGVEATDIAATITAENGQITLKDMAFNFYDGTYEGRALFDFGVRPVIFEETGQIKGVRVGRALTDYFGQDMLSGTLDLNYDLNSKGPTPKDMMANMAGKMAVDISDGAITYKQLSRRINQAALFLKQARLVETQDDTVKFTSLSASLQGEDGRFRNSDLKMTAPHLYALGGGLVDIGDLVIDYGLDIGLGSTEAGKDTKNRSPCALPGLWPRLNTPWIPKP